MFRQKNQCQLIHEISIIRHIYVIVVLLLSSGAVSGGLEKVLILWQFIADIYQQFPHSCIFIINCKAQHQGEDRLYIIHCSCVLVVKRNLLISS